MGSPLPTSNPQNGFCRSYWILQAQGAGLHVLLSCGLSMGAHCGLKKSQVPSFQPSSSECCAAHTVHSVHNPPHFAPLFIILRCTEWKQIASPLLPLCWPGCSAHSKSLQSSSVPLLKEVSLGTTNSLSSCSPPFNQSIRCLEWEQIAPTLLPLHWPGHCSPRTLCMRGLCVCDVFVHLRSLHRE